MKIEPVSMEVVLELGHPVFRSGEGIDPKRIGRLLRELGDRFMEPGFVPVSGDQVFSFSGPNQFTRCAYWAIHFGDKE